MKGRFGRFGRFVHFQKIPKSEGGSKPIFRVRPGGVRAGGWRKMTSKGSICGKVWKKNTFVWKCNSLMFRCVETRKIFPHSYNSLINIYLIPLTTDSYRKVWKNFLLLYYFILPLHHTLFSFPKYIQFYIFYYFKNFYIVIFFHKWYYRYKEELKMKELARGEKFRFVEKKISTKNGKVLYQ